MTNTTADSMVSTDPKVVADSEEIREEAPAVGEPNNNRLKRFGRTNEIYAQYGNTPGAGQRHGHTNPSTGGFQK